ncbi:hypothetical protein ANSO36C_44110 [Nostoc cf. commune SO-36]|uniref:Uncharacterized protein n=1 Tax=Nostoc cf. commune SO-36 TaxID=449208 RepID=A0ABM7Z686_NOSCO|nr:hypothetical protein [Nostoc commune]BDI18609.1 hypothetical protein ANSO36C_44110 [Nostoc cf. commune SO-36]
MKFIQVGDRLINLSAIAIIELSEDKITMLLTNSTQERLEFSGQIAQDIKDYFNNQKLVDIVPPPPRPPLEAV